MADVEAEARHLTQTLLSAREPTASICPSEVAKLLAITRRKSDWRAMMPAVHQAVDGLVAEGKVVLSWKGQPLDPRAGPYRIAQARG